MPTNKDNMKSGSRGSMSDTSRTGSSDREFESQGQNQGSKGSSGGQHTGSSHGYGKDTGMQGNMDDDEMDTAGGRKGNFSDKNRDSEGQWSPGSSGGSSDQ
jgi:hypothetical protein